MANAGERPAQGHGEEPGAAKKALYFGMVTVVVLGALIGVDYVPANCHYHHHEIQNALPPVYRISGADEKCNTDEHGVETCEENILNGYYKVVTVHDGHDHALHPEHGHGMHHHGSEEGGEHAEEASESEGHESEGHTKEGGSESEKADAEDAKKKEEKVAPEEEASDKHGAAEKSSATDEEKGHAEKSHGEGRRLDSNDRRLHGHGHEHGHSEQSDDHRDQLFERVPDIRKSVLLHLYLIGFAPWLHKEPTIVTPVMYFNKGWKLKGSMHAKDYEYFFQHSKADFGPPIGRWKKQHDHGTHIVVASGASDNESITIARLLLTFMVVCFVLLYLVNAEDPQIKAFAWHMISTIVSIFLAVLVNQAIASFFLDQILSGTTYLFTIPGTDIDVMSGFGIPRSYAWEIRIGILLFLFFWFFLSVFGWTVREDHIDLEVAKGLCGHVSAFACIRAFGNLQAMFCHPTAGIPTSFGIFLGVVVFGFAMRQVSHMFRASKVFPDLASNSEHWMDSLLVLLINIASCLKHSFFWCLLCPFLCYDKVSRDGLQAPSLTSRRTTMKLDERRKDKDYGAHWVEDVEEGEDECFSISLAFLLSQALLFHVLGGLQPMHADGKHHDWPDIKRAMYIELGCVVWMMISSSRLVSGFLSVIDGLLPSSVQGAKGHLKIIDSARMLGAFTFSWTGVKIVEWVGSAAFHNPAKMQIFIAILVTGGCVVFVILVDRVSDIFVARSKDKEEQTADGSRGLSIDNTVEELEKNIIHSCKIFMNAAAFLTGICWEKAFHVAEEEVLITIPGINQHLVLSKTVTSAFFVCLVTPAWLKYIVPKTRLAAKASELDQTAPSAREKASGYKQLQQNEQEYTPLHVANTTAQSDP